MPLEDDTTIVSDGQGNPDQSELFRSCLSQNKSFHTYIHVVAIPDRYDDLSDEDVGDLASDSFLINGRGRFGDNNAPLIVHRVQSGDNYLFRFINVGFDNMFEVSLATSRSD